MAIRVCRLEEIPLGLGRAFNIHGYSIAIFRPRSGRVHAMDNECPHRGGPLADGLLAGDRVVCPLHAYKFNLESGECEQKNICSVNTWIVQIHDGWLHVEVPVNAGCDVPCNS
jgi:nitrite reductase (NADH) small subunit